MTSDGSVPFAGLDIESRTILLDFFNNIAENAGKDENLPYIILGMERWHEIPDAITNVIEFKDKAISFCGTRADYEKLIQKRTEENAANIMTGRTRNNKVVHFEGTEDMIGTLVNVKMNEALDWCLKGEIIK